MLWWSVSWCRAVVQRLLSCQFVLHYDDVIMGTIASQIASLTSVYSTVYSGADQSKHQSSASLAFVWGIHRGPVNSPHKWPVTRKMFPFDDVIMRSVITVTSDERNIVSNYWQIDCLFKRVNAFMALFVGKSTGDRWFPSRKASNAERSQQ